MSPDPTIDPAKLEALVTEVVRRQAAATRRVLADAVAAGDVAVYAPDDDGYRVVAVAGRKVARVHQSRLLPDRSAN